MIDVIAPPPDLRDWIDGGVIVDTGASLACSRFPALVSSMLITRTAGRVRRVRGGAAVDLPDSAFVCASTGPACFEHLGAVRAVGLILKPQAVPALLRDSPHGLIDRSLAAHDAFGSAWTKAEAQLHDARTDRDRIGVLLDFVRRAVIDSRHDERRRQMERVAAAVCVGLDTACRELSISRRQLERRFAADFGMGPKRFQTIVRMSTALRRVARGSKFAKLTDSRREEPKDLQPGAALAADLGYYDQSHFARDLRRLTGGPIPDRLHSARAGPHEHWPLEAGLRLS